MKEGMMRVWGVLVLVIVGCGGPDFQGVEGESAAAGCLDADGAVHDGTSAMACGGSGESCEVCEPECKLGPSGPAEMCAKPSGGAIFQYGCVDRHCQILPEADVFCCNGYACTLGAKGIVESACSTVPK